MKLSKKTKFYSAAIVALLITAVILRIMTPSSTAKPPPNAPGYYTGPFRGKGNPNLAATEDGKQVDLPPLEKPLDASASKPESASTPSDKDAPPSGSQ